MQEVRDCLTVCCVRVFVWLIFISFSLPTYRFSDYFIVCAIAGQHDGHLPFWLPGFVKLIMLLLIIIIINRHFKNAQLTMNRHKGARGDAEPGITLIQVRFQ